MYKYSVLTYNFGGYEIMREVCGWQSDVEYIYVTDDKTLTSSTWNIVYDESLDGKDIFDKCYSVRFNPFKYCSTDICVRIDASIQLLQPIDKIINDFVSKDFDIAFMPHHCFDNISDEYRAWCTFRGYDEQKAFDNTKFFHKCGYDTDNYKGLYTGGIIIQKRNKKNEDINRMTYSFLKYLGDENAIERNDQIVFTFVINNFFENDLKIMPISASLVESDTLILMVHGRDDLRVFNRNPVYYDKAFVFNKETELYKY